MKSAKKNVSAEPSIPELVQFRQLKDSGNVEAVRIFDELQATKNQENFNRSVVAVVRSRPSNQCSTTVASETSSIGTKSTVLTAEVSEKPAAAFKLCHYFVRGKACPRGDSCPYLHSREEASGPDAAVNHKNSKSSDVKVQSKDSQIVVDATRKESVAAKSKIASKDNKDTGLKKDKGEKKEGKQAAARDQIAMLTALPDVVKDKKIIVKEDKKEDIVEAKMITAKTSGPAASLAKKTAMLKEPKKDNIKGTIESEVSGLSPVVPATVIDGKRKGNKKENALNAEKKVDIETKAKVPAVVPVADAKNDKKKSIAGTKLLNDDGKKGVKKANANVATTTGVLVGVKEEDQKAVVKEDKKGTIGEAKANTAKSSIDESAKKKDKKSEKKIAVLKTPMSVDLKDDKKIAAGGKGKVQVEATQNGDVVNTSKPTAHTIAFIPVCQYTRENVPCTRGDTCPYRHNVVPNGVATTAAPVSNKHSKEEGIGRTTEKDVISTGNTSRASDGTGAKHTMKEANKMGNKKVNSSNSSYVKNSKNNTGEHHNPAGSVKDGSNDLVINESIKTNHRSGTKQAAKDTPVNTVVKGVVGDAALGLSKSDSSCATSEVHSSFMQSLIQASEVERENIDEGKRLLRALRLKRIGVHTVGQRKDDTVGCVAHPSLFTSNEPFLSLSRPPSVSKEISALISTGTVGMSEEAVPDVSLVAQKVPSLAAPNAAESTEQGTAVAESADSSATAATQAKVDMEVAAVSSVKASKKTKKKPVSASSSGPTAVVPVPASTDAQEVPASPAVDSKPTAAVSKLNQPSTASSATDNVPTAIDTAANQTSSDEPVPEVEIEVTGKKMKKTKKKKDKKKALELEEVDGDKAHHANHTDVVCDANELTETDGNKAAEIKVQTVISADINDIMTPSDDSESLNRDIPVISVDTIDKGHKSSVENSPALAAQFNVSNAVEVTEASALFDSSALSDATPPTGGPPSLPFPPNLNFMGQHGQENVEYPGPPLPYGMAPPFFHPPHGLPPMPMEGYPQSHPHGFPPMPPTGFPSMPFYPPNAGPPLPFPTGLAEYHNNGSGIASFPMQPAPPVPPHMMHLHPSQFPPRGASHYPYYPPSMYVHSGEPPFDPAYGTPYPHVAFDDRHHGEHHPHIHPPQPNASPPVTFPDIIEQRTFSMIRGDSPEPSQMSSMSTSAPATSTGNALSRNNSSPQIPLEAEGNAGSSNKASPAASLCVPPTPSIVVVDGVPLTSLPIPQVLATSQSPLSASRNSANPYHTTDYSLFENRPSSSSKGAPEASLFSPANAAAVKATTSTNPQSSSRNTPGSAGSVAAADTTYDGSFPLHSLLLNPVVSPRSPNTSSVSGSYGFGSGLGSPSRLLGDAITGSGSVGDNVVKSASEVRGPPPGFLSTTFDESNGSVGNTDTSDAALIAWNASASSDRIRSPSSMLESPTQMPAIRSPARVKLLNQQTVSDDCDQLFTSPDKQEGKASALLSVLRSGGGPSSGHQGKKVHRHTHGGHSAVARKLDMN